MLGLHEEELDRFFILAIGDVFHVEFDGEVENQNAVLFGVVVFQDPFVRLEPVAMTAWKVEKKRLIRPARWETNEKVVARLRNIDERETKVLLIFELEIGGDHLDELERQKSRLKSGKNRELKD